MTFLNNQRSKAVRAAIIGLDGTPYSFLKKEMAAGRLPNLARLDSRASFLKMKTEIPTISSVAWASFMTGKNPGEHGIFGFTDRKHGTYQLCFPNYSHVKAEPIWDILGRRGKRCCVLNVPSTYPARPVNGILVSGFVAPNLQKATFPRETYEFLEKIGYRVDVDSSKARESLDLLLEDLHATTDKRREVMLTLWEQERWDLFMCVFTGTDRLHHFMWRLYEEEDPVYHREFIRFYQKIDEIVGEFIDGLSDDVALFMLSDHGFCSIEHEVYLNVLLADHGYLAFKSNQPRMLDDIDPVRTRAYCLDPGRIYVNLKGREPAGIVEPGVEQESLIEDLTALLRDLKSPETDEKIIASVFRAGDIYDGPQIASAPDLVAHPLRGYDLKGTMAKKELTGHTGLSGMHTEDDALTWISEGNDLARSEGMHIRDLASHILKVID